FPGRVDESAWAACLPRPRRCGNGAWVVAFPVKAKGFWVKAKEFCVGFSGCWRDRLRRASGGARHARAVALSGGALARAGDGAGDRWARSFELCGECAGEWAA